MDRLFSVALTCRTRFAHVVARRACTPALLGLALLAVAGTSLAQVRPDQLLDEHVIRQGTAEEQGFEVGEQVDTADGSLRFRQVDIAIPGNNALEVSLARRYSVKEKRHLAAGALAFGDWAFDLPRIRTISRDWITSNTANPNARCSINSVPDAIPPQYTFGSSPGRWFASPYHYWTPASIDVPEDAGLLLMHNLGAAAPGNGLVTKWTTLGRTSLSCLPTIRNGAGEGFYAVTTNGKRYRFDWMAKERHPDIVGPVGSGGFLPRYEYSLYATRVEDHLGNWVEYDYLASAEGARLSAIRSSDGRRIDVKYDAAGLAESASAAGRTWRYGYAVDARGKQVLSQATLPDTSAWRFDLAGLDAAKRSTPMGSGIRCNAIEPPLATGEFTGTVTSPAGLRTQFTVKATRFGRSNVPRECTSNNENLEPLHLITYGVFSLIRKTVDGPGISTRSWNYRYTSAYGFAPFTNGSNTTEVVASDGASTRYRHGNVHGGNDGLLIGVDRLTATGTVLESKVLKYGLPPSQSFVRLGTSPSVHRMNFNEEHLRPEAEVTITQGGVTFTRKHEVFDTLARPTQTRLSNTRGTAKTQVVTYQDDLTRWLLGQIKRVTVNGIETERTEFNAQQLPAKTYAFGKLQQTLTYDTTSLPTTGQLGTIKTVSDGRDGISGAETTYTLSSWKRGVPQSVRAPITPSASAGALQTAVVNDDGTVGSLTNEVGSKTCYGYDAGGRINSITQPSEAAVATCNSTTYAQTTLQYVPVGVAEYGLAANHWKRTVSTGNARTVTYFDAMWRPVIEESYDASNTAATRTVKVTRYDFGGRVGFQSYPVASLVNYADTKLAGVRTSYDALDRVTSVEQDSEFGPLRTTTGYLADASGLYTLVTNPRGFQTRTWFQMFDAPDYSNPVTITHPEGAITTIARDVFGKPTALVRRNADSSVSSRRTYTYSTVHELCRVDEPESKTTFFGRDLAGNLAWQAGGYTGVAPGCATAASVVARRSDRTFDAQNRILSLTFPGGLGNTTYTYTADGLLASLTADNGSGNRVTTAYGYNRRRLLTSERMTLGSIDWSMGYAYNALGHLSTQTYPGALSVAYAPNALGQPTQVGAFATSARYFPNGALKQFTYGNQVTHTLTQNLRQLPDTATDAYGATKIVSDGYDYDANGNVAAITDGATGRAQRGNRTMTYDGLDRLKSVASPMYGSTGAQYAYDVLDNLTRVNVGGAKSRNHYYCYQPSTWQLTNVKTGSCAGASVIGLGYDEQGNLKSKNGLAYTFDFGNRLRSVGGTSSSSYVYDGHGRRVRDHTTASKYSLYTTAGQLAFDSDARTGKQHHYLHLGDRLVAVREKTTASGAIVDEYQHTDALGSPVAATNAARSIVERSEYEPYGQVIAPTTPSDGPGYTGHVYDAATGMIYMQQRYFDPPTGRFMSVDPIAVDTASGHNFNRYWYGNNSPYNFDDPDGQQSRGALEGPMETFGHVLADQAIFQIAKGEYQRASTPDQKSAAANKLSMAYGMQGFHREEQRLRGEADVWGRKITMRNPNSVHHLQSSVSAKFSDGGSVEGMVQQLKDTSGAATKNILPIRVFILDGKLYTLDHRRLYAHQAAGVPIQTVQATPQEVMSEFNRKSSGYEAGSDGRKVKVKAAPPRVRSK